MTFIGPSPSILSATSNMRGSGLANPTLPLSMTALTGTL
jgi:hypothetical protein